MAIPITFQTKAKYSNTIVKYDNLKIEVRELIQVRIELNAKLKEK